MASNATKSRNRKYEVFEKALMERRDELTSRLSERMSDVHVEREPDDEAALASDSSTKEMAVATLERERRMLAEIEAALLRLKKGEYGLCAGCGEPIPDARLKALPWARVCVRCAERGSRSSGLAAD